MTHILIDFNNLAFRTKHAIRGDADMKGSMAIHIFFTSLSKLWKKFDGTHIVVALEGRNSWRKAFYPEYKAHRAVKKAQRTAAEQEEDEIFFEYMNELSDYLKERTNVTVLQVETCEADDAIGRWIQLHPENDHVILSSDTDFYQLLAPNVRIYNGIKNETISLTDVLDDNGNHVEVSVKKLDENGKIVKEDGKQVMVMADKPAPDPEWELFKKIMRGDPGDNVFRACVKGLRETKIKEAYDERHDKGFVWNNVMLDEWEDHNEVKMTVWDRYCINETLVDLSKQPEEIRDYLDHEICATLDVSKKPSVGVWFMKFCNEFDLKKLDQFSKTYIPILNASYGEGE